MKIQEFKFDRELEAAMNAAENAGRIIDDYAGKEIQDSKKEDGSIVTEADIDSQKAIVNEIKKQFPEDGFLGEEEHLNPDGEERIWVIDPIDGTFNFSKNFDYHCVSIALQIDGDTVLGLVLSPDSSVGKTYFGMKDEGAYKVETYQGLNDASEIEVSSYDQIKGSIYLASMFNIYEGELELEKKVITSLAKENATNRQLGACALELCYLAEGRVDFMYNTIAKKWDYSAGKIIVKEAGGKIRTQESKFPKSFEITASNGELQEKLEKIVDNLDK